MKYQVETYQGLKWIKVASCFTEDEAAAHMDNELKLGSSVRIRKIRQIEKVLYTSFPTVDLRAKLVEAGVLHEITH